jgi:hypothetical protein
MAINFEVLRYWILPIASFLALLLAFLYIIYEQKESQ